MDYTSIIKPKIYKGRKEDLVRVKEIKNVNQHGAGPFWDLESKVLTSSPNTLET